MEKNHEKETDQYMPGCYYERFSAPDSGSGGIRRRNDNLGVEPPRFREHQLKDPPDHAAGSKGYRSVHFKRLEQGHL